MSYTEFHTGKLYPVNHGRNLEMHCRIIAKSHDIELGDDWLQDFREAFDRFSKRDYPSRDEYFVQGENLYLVVDHQEINDSQYDMKLHQNDDGSINFAGQFYNGGTCFEEMLDDALVNFNSVKD